MINAVAHRHKAITIDAEELPDVRSRRVAHGDDGVLATGELLSDHTSVNHPAPVILSCKPKRSQVVNRGDLGTRSMRNHPPIAGRMEHIQPEPTGKLWKARLMPKNVANRWPKGFRHRHDAHRIGGEGEERHVFFQHKERELVPRSLL